MKRMHTKAKSSGSSVLRFCVLAAALSVGGTLAAIEVRGRLVDGTAMLRAAGASAGAIDQRGFTAAAQRVPIAGAAFKLHLSQAGEGTRAGKSWPATTDGDGLFRIDIPEVASGDRLVAELRDGAGGRPAHYSMPVAVSSGSEVEFRLYGASGDTAFLSRSRLGILCSLDRRADGQELLRVQVSLQVQNASGDLYVGGHLETVRPSSQRACFRIPLPGRPRDGFFEVINNTVQPQGISPWTITPDGWAILDAPIPPYPEAPQGSRFDLEFLARPAQEMVLSFPIDFPLESMFALGRHQDMDLTSSTPRGADAPALEKAGVQKLADPRSGEPVDWVILQGENIPQGTVVPVAVLIDNVKLQQWASRSVKTVTGFIVGAVIALLAGLVLGRRGPRVETVLSEASGEEMIERIAQLDAQFKRGLVAKADYEAARERLLELARYEVPELGAAAAGAGSGGGGMAPELRDLLRRIQDLEKSTEPAKIQERLVLLEDLARKLASESKGQRSPKPEGAR
jgi:hypothetical protein